MTIAKITISSRQVYSIGPSRSRPRLWCSGRSGVAQRDLAERLAAAVGCGGTSSTVDLVNCLREVPAKDLILSADRTFKLWSLYPGTFTFRPNVEPGVEGAFLPADPRALIDAGEFSPVPWITGVNRDEGGTFASCEYTDGGVAFDLFLFSKERKKSSHLTIFSSYT
ncbi:Esterase P [Amphibalanus amphitrite]|uniref:Esterase P n=1 Tax=Amphibalanus amphitrite TaxID=1232801 RepID=A0A6A4W1N7_AMPAM|nr:Esterase P [Amphibalanus amphitrite]